MNVKEKRRQTPERQLKWHLCIILCCLLFLKGVPMTVLAADDYHVSVNGVGVDSANAEDVLGDGTVSYDSVTNTLSLDNASLQSIKNDTGEAFTIHVTGQNSVTRISTGGAKKLINSNSALTINGSGTLELSGIDGNDSIQCVSASGTVTVDGVRLTMVNAYDAGIASSGDIVVLNHAYVTGNTGKLFCATSGKLTITNSTVKAPDGNGEITGWNAVWVKDLEIKDSVMEIDAPSQAVYASGNMVIDKSDITVNSQSIPGQPGLWAEEILTITDSTVKAESFNHIPVYAGGDLTISGGSIEAVTSHTSAAAFRSGNGSITIAGPITVSTTTVGGTVCKAKNGIVIKTSLRDSDSKMYEVNAGDTLADMSEAGTGCFNAGTDVAAEIGTRACFRIDEHTRHIYSQETVKEEALITAADCTNAAVCFKSCSCGLVSTDSADIFVTGTPAGHKTVHYEAVEPNCSAAGNVEYWECESCNKYFSDEAGTAEVKPENTVIDKAPDRHISDGSGWHSDKDGHWNTCVCGEILNNTGHTLTWVIDREATEDTSGLKHEECSVCGFAKAAVEIPASQTATDPTKPEEPAKPEEPTNSEKPSESEEPSKPGEPDNPGETIEPDEQDDPFYEELPDSTVSPRTGDNSNTAFWFVMAVIAGTVFVSMLYWGEGKREEQ